MQLGIGWLNVNNYFSRETKKQDLVYFTRRVQDTSYASATRVTEVQHECNTSDTSETRATRVRHECYTNDTSATRVKNLDFHNEKTYFHTPMSAIWLRKDYKEMNNFVLRTNFWICILSMTKCVWKVHHKTELCNRKL